MKWFCMVAAVTALLQPCSAGASEGYFKDLFMDGGAHLTGKTSLPAADMLGLTYDKVATADAAARNKVMVTGPDDLNGALLYPDGAPRYRVIYTNGGSATKHGLSLGTLGRQRVRDFVAGGGSYTGSCAGAFLAHLAGSKSDYQKNGPRVSYYHLWPGIGPLTGVNKSYHDIHFINLTHPLVKKYASLSDGKVASVYHNGGCRYNTTYFPVPKGTEFLGKMHNPALPGLHGYFNMMAYKKDAKTGRVVVTCSHPESVTSGERRDLMAAILTYAMDGAGTPPQDKGVLKSAAPVVMDMPTTKLGDRQYHHYRLVLPAPTKTLKVVVQVKGDNINLYLRKGGRAHKKNAQHKAESFAPQNKTLSLSNLAAGTWYVAVYGDHLVRNGGAYTLTATWTLLPPPLPDGGGPKPDGPPADLPSIPKDSGSPPDMAVQDQQGPTPDMAVQDQQGPTPDMAVQDQQGPTPDISPAGPEAGTGAPEVPDDGCSVSNGRVSACQIFWIVAVLGVFARSRRRRGRGSTSR